MAIKTGALMAGTVGAGVGAGTLLGAGLLHRQGTIDQRTATRIGGATLAVGGVGAAAILAEQAGVVDLGESVASGLAGLNLGAFGLLAVAGAAALVAPTSGTAQAARRHVA